METSFVLGDPVLHSRLCLVTEVLAHFLCPRPRSLRIDQLGSRIHRPHRELVSLCRKLEGTGLLVKDEDRRDSWRIPRHRTDMTLWDVYLFVAAQRASVCLRGNAGSDEWLAPGIELQWMQAALAANQSIAKRLQQFPLDQIAKSAHPVV